MEHDSTARHKPVRNTALPVRRLRLAVQIIFAAVSIAVGIQFTLFVRYLASGGAAPFVPRPPGVEAFLPISSLMSLVSFFATGVIHPAHPAGLLIFAAILLISLIFGKSFCSWVCPIGLISERLAAAGERLLGRRLAVPRWLDYPLRSLKYFLLGFFLISIFVIMGMTGVGLFLDSPYNLVADIKMYAFFADLSNVAVGVLIVLALASVFVRGAWCRYLCPYGALLGLASLTSFFKIRRVATSCIDCGLCAKACPSRIAVDQVETVRSDECTACMKCVDACPVADTLILTPVFSRRRIPALAVAVTVVVLMLAAATVGRLTGHWDNGITRERYLTLFRMMPAVGHPGGSGQAAPFELDEQPR